MNKPLIGLDLMGSDCRAEDVHTVLLDLASEKHEGISLLIFGTPHMIGDLKHFKKKYEKKLGGVDLSYWETSEEIAMDEDPLFAVRRKKNASLCVGMQMLKDQKLDAFVSIGNTGALIASAKMYLSMLSNIARPALCALLPTKKNPVAVLDVGANVTCSTEHLVQFAMIGIAYQKSRGIDNPRVGLLNIGTEAKKGRQELREAYQVLSQLSSIAFNGNIEGREVFSGSVDVLVTDGFTGNVFLKTSEGISAFILDELCQHRGKILFSESVLKRLQIDLNYAEYPGAILCGVDGIVVKCHGDSNPDAIKNSIKGAIKLVKSSFLDKIKGQLEGTVGFYGKKNSI